MLVPGVVGVLLLLASAWSWNSGHHRADARTARASGVVESVDAQPVGRGRVLSGSITIDFNGGADRAVVEVGADAGKYAAGQGVTVRYQPGRPSNASVTGSSGQSSGWIVSGFFGVTMAGLGAWSARHLRKLRNLLQQHPWQARPARVAEIPFQIGLRVRAQIVVVLWDPIDERESIVVPAGVRRVNPSFEPVTWLCGDLAEGRVAISPPGGRPPLLARVVNRPAHWPEVGGWPQ
ncbi:MAG: hypothetical protein JWL70_3172 [Acidimicrobiia bacterium]|nr:hypothetical protein [Acidimicrobiia bacterium]